MPENEFEHRVQQKMDEFHLRPSSQVWEEVERRIRKQKRRRIVFWWILLPLLITGAITTGLLMNSRKAGETVLVQQAKNDKEKNNHTIATTIGTKELEARTNALPPDVNQPTINQVAQPDTTTAVKEPLHTNAATIQPDNNTVNATKKAITKRPVQKQNAVTKNNKNSGLLTSQQIANSQGGGNKKKKPQQPQPAPNAVSDPKAAVVKQDAENKTKDVAAIVPPIADTISGTAINTPAVVAAIPATAAAPDKQDTPADSANKKTSTPIKVKPKQKKWELSGYAGRSAIINGFGLFKAESATAVPNTLGGPPQLFVIRPSVVRPGFAAGLSLSRVIPVSPRLQFTTGLGYDYMSTRIQVGQRIDSNFRYGTNSNMDVSGQFYYRSVNASGALQSYTNQYHFISLSASLNWTILKGNKFSIQWRNELQYRQLIASSMLHFDYGLNGYYKNNALLNKANLFLQTSIAVPAGKKLLINPYFNYGITPVLRSPATSRHYTGMGLRLIFSLPKK